ncbi:ABC transporter ATP-binding protein [Dokdonella sp.]|uniref:ABC transporter ATP-binding protein n=1 Tax=Dokdonella sp. TaxID=2291710 RepID=UPI001B0D9CA5|nr:ABC transporter ATP-binding protein [Dokdonella sp.]MBO9664756.1 ABC transporter ATP-binding protein [Dokdonella sp.]
MNLDAPVASLRGVAKTYATDGGPVHALRGVDLDIRRGEHTAIVGGSGSGKTTLLSLLGCLDRPSAGSVAIHGVVTSQLDDEALASLRNEGIGFVFQQFHLIRSASVAQNVELPLYYRGVARAERRRRAAAALDAVGLGDLAQRFPQQLSGGQQQRVAIARAIVGDPHLLLADEPTGNLDAENAALCLRMLMADAAGDRTLVVVTHDLDLARRCRRVVTLRAGECVDDRVD